MFKHLIYIQPALMSLIILSLTVRVVTCPTIRCHFLSRQAGAYEFKPGHMALDETIFSRFIDSTLCLITHQAHSKLYETPRNGGYHFSSQSTPGDADGWVPNGGVSIGRILSNKGSPTYIIISLISSSKYVEVYTSVCLGTGRIFRSFG